MLRSAMNDEILFPTVNGGAGHVLTRGRVVLAATAIITTAILAGCASESTSIVSDDASLCEYSAAANGDASISVCRDRLDRQHRRLAAASAIRIDGYALLNRPGPSIGIAERCKAPDAPKDCRAGDVTGTIPTTPAR